MDGVLYAILFPRRCDGGITAMTDYKQAPTGNNPNRGNGTGLNQGHVWLATISDPYRAPIWWKAGLTKDRAKEKVLEELESEHNESHEKPSWGGNNDEYDWLKDSDWQVEVRRIEVV